MALQDSTFRTAHVMDNEIVKANDFEFAFEQLIENVSKATQMLLESNQDFVINGKVIPSTGMNVSVSPIYGVCKSTGLPFGRTETTDETIGFEGSSSGRIDILEVKGDWESYDNQQRAFNDPDTDTQTYQYVDTKKLMKPVYQIKKGVEGSGIAPDVDSGWVKLAEVSIRAGATSILATDIHNITADVAGLENEDWTNEQDITYNIGYISDVNARFRVQHNADGTHAVNSINSDSLDIGIGSKQINGNILPVGGSVSIPGQTISSTDSILSVIVKAATLITSIYDKYLKYGDYSFKGEVNISNLIDSSNELIKPITISADGEGNAYIKIDGNTVLSIDSNGKLSTNGYTATANNHLVTKVVTDAISTALSALTVRVANIENTSDTTVYANNTLSSGTDGRYNLSSVAIYVATTQNITLSGSQSIDGVAVSDGLFVLVKDQTNKKENGIYQVSTSSAWSRVSNFPTPGDLRGLLFNVSNGNTNSGKIFYMPKVNFSNLVNYGYDDIPFSEYFGSIKPLANKIVMRDSNGDVKGNVTGSSASCTGNAATATSAGYATKAGYATSAGSATSATNATNAGNADTVDGYHTSENPSGSTIAARTSSGYLNAKIFHDEWAAENINSFSSPKIMFKGNGDGYIRNTDPSNVSVGYATSAGSASSATTATKAGYATSAGSASSASNSGALEGKSWRETALSGLYVTDNTSSLSGASYTFSPSAPVGSAKLAVGSTVKVTFANPLQSSKAITSVNFNYGGRNGQIVAARQNTLVGLASHVFQGGEYSAQYPNKVWDAYTTLELMWTGSYWLVMGDAVLCSYFSSDANYTVKANGLINQWGKLNTGSIYNLPVTYVSVDTYRAVQGFKYYNNNLAKLWNYTNNSIRAEGGPSETYEISFETIGY